MKDLVEQKFIKLKTEMHAECCTYCITVGRLDYIGVTKNFSRRIKQHIESAYCNNNTKKEHEAYKVHKAMRESLIGFSVEIIFHGSEDDCYAEEKRLRPKATMGLNTAPGGAEEDLAGAVPSQNTFKVKNVRRAEPGELHRTFKYPNTVIKTDRGEYINSAKSLKDWESRKGQYVNATLGKTYAGGWQYIIFKHVIK